MIGSVYITALVFHSPIHHSSLTSLSDRNTTREDQWLLQLTKNINNVQQSEDRTLIKYHPPPFFKNSEQEEQLMTSEQSFGFQILVVKMAQTFNPGGGPGQMLPPPEVSGNPGQDPIFNFGGDGVGPDANIVTALTEGSRKRVKADQGESGPVRRLVASQFGTVNAKLDNTLKKVASQQNETDHLRQKLDEAHEYNREQRNQFAVKWASVEKLLERLDNNREQPPRRQERLWQQPQTAHRTEGGQRDKPPPIPPRPREPTVNSNININVNPGNQRPAHKQ
jgi:hypothetical protein